MKKKKRKKNVLTTEKWKLLTSLIMLTFYGIQIDLNETKNFSIFEVIRLINLLENKIT